MSAIEMISHERQRQINEDKESLYKSNQLIGELAEIGCVYAKCAILMLHGEETEMMIAEGHWPFEEMELSDNPVENLVKAGAMIAAEIDRITDMAQNELR